MKREVDKKQSTTRSRGDQEAWRQLGVVARVRPGGSGRMAADKQCVLPYR